MKTYTTPYQSPNGDSFLVCRLGQIAKRLPPAICDLDRPHPNKHHKSNGIIIMAN
ncbi:MAG: hypothetical protein SPH44_05820 [Eubacteriales bacterium]|nr:hypothetical protein [Eubacteriales bacterium]